MVINNFKTTRKYGCNQIKVSDYEYVYRQVRAYVQKIVKKSLQETLLHHQTFSIYLEKAFKQHKCGLMFTTTTMRKAPVNLVIKKERNEEVPRTVARLMYKNSAMISYCLLASGRRKLITYHVR